MFTKSSKVIKLIIVQAIIIMKHKILALDQFSGNLNTNLTTLHTIYCVKIRIEMSAIDFP